jgi:hypothetical protein
MSVELRESETDILTVPQLATRLQVRTSWIYSHADELGAFRLGKYLRFSWERVLSRLAANANHRRSRFALGSQPNDLHEDQ